MMKDQYSACTTVNNQEVENNQVKLAQRQKKRNVDSALKLERDMFDWRSRHNILNLTLRYNKDHRANMTLADIQMHRDKLLNNRRTNKLLQGIDGYVWAIEEGEDEGGIHMHTTIFYDGRRAQDVNIAQSIGEYWIDVITDGKGAYYNSNTDKERLKKNGSIAFVGQVNRGDNEKREALRNHFDYLAKAEQLVKNRTGNDRMFGTSQTPKK